MARSESGSDFDGESLKKDVKVRGGNQLWYLNSGCSRHMTGDKSSFLSLIALDRRRVALGNGKSETIVGVGKIGKSLSLN